MAATVTLETYDRNGNRVAVGEFPVAAEQINADDLRQKMQQALAANAAFLALATPTNAQILAQTQRLTRETSAVIRLLLGLLDDTTGT